MAAVEAVGGDGGLAVVRDQPVDEGLALAGVDVGRGGTERSAGEPVDAPPPVRQKGMALVACSLILPLGMRALGPAAVPVAAEPDDPSCVCIQGTTQGVE